MRWYEDTIIVLIFWLVYLPICLIIWYELASKRFFDLIFISCLGLIFTTVYLLWSVWLDNKPTVVAQVVEKKPRKKRVKKESIPEGGEKKVAKVDPPSPPSSNEVVKVEPEKLESDVKVESVEKPKKIEEVQHVKKEFEPGTELRSDVDLDSFDAVDDDSFS